MLEAITAWMPLAVAIIAAAATLASSVGRAARHSRLEKLITASSDKGTRPEVDVLIAVLASGLAIEEDREQQRSRVWWSLATGVAVVLTAAAVVVASWPEPLAFLDETSKSVVRTIGALSLALFLPLLVRSWEAVRRPRPVSMLPDPEGSFFKQTQRVLPTDAAAKVTATQ